MMQVPNPFQLSTAMMRMASYSLDCQLAMLRSFSKISMIGLPFSVAETSAEAPKKPGPARRKAAGTAGKPKRVSPRGKTTGAAKAPARRTRKPAEPPAMPDFKTSRPGDDNDNMPI